VVYNDTLAVCEVIDLICERANAIDISYPEKDERERHDSHEDLKICAVPPAWLDHYVVTYQMTAQQEAVNTRCRLLVQNNESRNMTFNGWTILLPLSDTHCGTL
jgi:hypothetical protein